MKVGVHVGPQVPEVGGGFTFAGEIVEQLAALAGETRHEFVLLAFESVSDTTPRRPGPMPNAQCLTPSVLPVGEAPASLPGRVQRRIRKLGQQALGAADDEEVARQRRVAERLAKHGIEVVFNLCPSSLPTLDIPFITIVWDLQHRLQPWFPEVSSGDEWRQREAAYGLLLRRAAVVIAGTEAGSQEIQRFYQTPPERIRRLPHPTPRFALETPPDDGRARIERLGVAPPYLFYPAQFWPHKNHVAILEAARLVQDQQGIPFNVVFSGSDRGNLAYVKEQAQRLGLLERVAFLGFVAREDLVALYQQAFSLVYASYFGPENLPPLEAFGLGCPVIAADVSGAREQLADAAILVDPKRPAEMAAALMQLHTQPELRNQLVERGRARARRFTGADFVRGLFQLLDEFEPIRRCWGTAHVSSH